MSSPPHVGGHTTVVCKESWMISWQYNIPSIADGLEPYIMSTDATMNIQFSFQSLVVDYLSHSLSTIIKIGLWVKDKS